MLEMSREIIRILFVADTHLGFDMPFRPRVKRRRRGYDFFENFERALEPAMTGKADLVVHGGDLFFRSRVPEALIDRAMTPLVNVAKLGIPVYIVPGNHERSRIPLNLWSIHPNLYIFDQAKTYLCEIRGVKLALVGFPFTRRIQETFGELLSMTGYEGVQCNIRILCMHQTVEGARVGPSDYTFRAGPDVILGADIPDAFCVVLSGHIHRAQMLTKDLKERPLKVPVLYPGSIERTSFAEREEEKQFVLINVCPDGSSKGNLIDVQFVPLPTRPMVKMVLEAGERTPDDILTSLRERLRELEPDAIVKIHLQESMSDVLANVFSAENLRKIAPPSMNVSVTYPRSSG
jgi:DNA repair exonuclease SbcCD nuclease subunit